MALTAKKVYAILKRQISDMEAKLNSPVRYRGTVATADLLPLNPDIGDMYNIESKSVYGEAGMNVAWNGVVWDTMGAPIDMSIYIKSSELADWAKQQNKPTYTADEVGALPDTTVIPSKTSELQNDSGFLTKIPDNYLSGTDKTLSVSGKAADAKATGDKITELSADISNKLNKNQGSENSGKIAGINESGDIVPMFPVSVDYNEETNCLEFGSDQKMELNKGINLDNTLTKTGYAADAGTVGEITNSLKEDIINVSDNTYILKWIPNKAIDEQGNIINASADSTVTEYIEIPEYINTLCFSSDNELYASCWYDSNKSFISRVVIPSGDSTVVKRVDAKYIVLTRTINQHIKMKTFDYSKLQELQIVNNKNGRFPIKMGTIVYNPNPNNEGLSYPASDTFGYYSILFDVSDINGQSVSIDGTSIGYIMQFSDMVEPSKYIGGKKNINKENNCEVKILDNAKYLTVNTFDNPYKARLTSLEDYVIGSRLKKYLSSYGVGRIYSAIGDSITAGSGASSYGNNYYWKLRKKLIKANTIDESYNFGSGGSTSYSISSFCGATALYITESITIPTIGDVIIKPNISIIDVAGHLSYCNPCYIDGIKGNLSYENSQYVFTREEQGTQKIIASGTTIITNAGLVCLKSSLLTIFVGTNDNAESEDKTINNVYQLSELSNNKRFIIILPYVKNVSDSFRHKMQNKFGQKCIDMYTYFSEQAVYDAINTGLLPSGDQSNWKALLLSDGVHPNDIGHELISNKIYDRMKVLGYLE